MALIVQEVSTQLSQIQEEIVEVKTCMSSEYPDKEDLDRLLNEYIQRNWVET